jgi:hypothetical protein
MYSDREQAKPLFLNRLLHGVLGCAPTIILIISYPFVKGICTILTSTLCIWMGEHCPENLNTLMAEWENTVLQHHVIF